jgi:hypothetical protein|tara:strand:- start:193 stop:327 length:135 start_codon:yes stop_codon:yes gene_type:complete
MLIHPKLYGTTYKPSGTVLGKNEPRYGLIDERLRLKLVLAFFIA